MNRLHCLLLLTFAVLFSSLAEEKTPSAVTLKLTPEILTPSVHRLGINLEADAWWGAAQLTKLRDWRNFEGVNYRSIFWGPQQPADGLFTWTGLPTSAPLNQWRDILTGSKFTVISGPGYGETGVVKAITNRSYNGRDLTFIEFDQPLTPGTGHQNAILIENTNRDTGLLDTITGHYWSSDSNEVVPDGDTGFALKMTSGGMLRLTGVRLDIATGDGPWRLTFRAKADQGTPNVSASLTTGSSKTEAVQPSADAWTDYEMTWNASGSSGEYLQCLINVSGGAVLVDDICLYQEGQSNPTAFRDELVSALRELQPGVLRKLQMGGSSITNCIINPQDSFSFAASVWTSPGQQGSPFKYDYSLHQFYELCEEVGTTPWFCIPGTLHPNEVTFFMEYLGGTGDTPGGKLRTELGHPTPWTETFERIHVEFGNEAWNSWGPFACSGFSGPDYWKNLIAAGKSSPYYRTNILFYAAGQNFVGSANKTVAKNTPNADRFAFAPYMIHGFYPEEEARLDSNEKLFQWLFAYPQVKLLRNEGMAENATIAQNGMELAIYEVNHHASAGKGSSETRNRFLTSIAGGLNILNTMLLSMENYGIRDMCFFTMFGEKNTAYEVKDVRLFGALLSMKEGEVRLRPHWQAMQIANQVLSGDMVRIEKTGKTPTYSSEIYDHRKKEFHTENGLETFFPYAFANGKQRSLTRILHE